MTNNIVPGFADEIITLPLEQILPSRLVNSKIKKTKKYQQISVSIREIGLVEPLAVYPQHKNPQSYLLLDGHLRMAALAEAGVRQARCLVATDDEAFTYNKRISRLATIQEHYMIRQALRRGVSEEKLAAALGVNVARIREKKSLLKGICPEAIEILKNRHFPAGTISVLRKMKPLRQVETVELMVAVNNFSISYAKALLVATPDDQLNDPASKKPVKGLSDEETARMESEMEKLRRDMKAVEEDYGTNVVRLVVANGYISRLLNNEHITNFLDKNYSEILAELQSLTEALTQEQGL